MFTNPLDVSSRVAAGWLLVVAAAVSTDAAAALGDDAALRRAESIGAQLYRHDMAAAIATDEVRTLPVFKMDQRLRGWVTEEHPGGIAVTFTDESAAALYRVDLPDDENTVGDLMVFETPRAPTPYELAAVHARRTAIDSASPPCRGRYNVVVLPVEAGNLDRWSVYFLRAVADRARIPVGGAFRVEVTGKTAAPAQQYSQSCIDVDDSGNTAALMVTHPLGPVPTEIHVFWNLLAEKPLAVVTDDGRTWMIEGGRIRPLAAEGR